jgi:hypothetical protein
LQVLLDFEGQDVITDIHRQRAEKRRDFRDVIKSAVHDRTDDLGNVTRHRKGKIAREA